MHQHLVPSQSTLQVSLVNYTDDFVPSASNVADVMTMIPGMGPSGFGQPWSSLSYDFRPSPISRSQAPVQPYPSASVPATPVSNSHLDFAIPMHTDQASHYNPARHHSIHLEQPPVTLPIHPLPPPVSIERAPPLAVERGGPFRPSMYELEPGFGSAMRAQPFQTSIFRK
jgi:ubiquitin thioesterase protein OTUB1